ncbi:hypothetical protein SAY86_011515 [Trapa natans]|uniref:CCT domain-containing protein n=1 Tax=Trapa natans TaxID=22666 RepID=A0AAN7R2V9_TRANT|nr:hypothetical protein SAY86_011515 [Trapa natans]
MNAGADLLFSCFQIFSPDIHPFEEFYEIQKPNDSLNKVQESAFTLEYDISGGEGDLFPAPEPIFEETVTVADPITSEMLSCWPQECSAHHQVIQLFQVDSILSETFHECSSSKEYLLGKHPINASTPTTELLDVKKTPLLPIDEDKGSDDKSSDLHFQEHFSEVDLQAVWGIRRPLCEGGIKSTGVSTSTSSSCSEERREKLERYRNKKTKRNFGRKIKYACRKVLADSQPRIRGRFARAEGYEISKMQR